MYCMKCGAEIPQEAKFCPSCGAPVADLNEPAQQAPVSPRPAPVQQPTPIPPQNVNVRPTAAPEQRPSPLPGLQNQPANNQMEFKLFGRTITMRNGMIGLAVLVVLLFMFANC